MGLSLRSKHCAAMNLFVNKLLVSWASPNLSLFISWARPNLQTNNWPNLSTTTPLQFFLGLLKLTSPFVKSKLFLKAIAIKLFHNICPRFSNLDYTAQTDVSFFRKVTRKCIKLNFCFSFCQCLHQLDKILCDEEMKMAAHFGGVT